jgi:nitrite reductase/ring-hydroxylating ferredoxin subunit
VSRSPIDPTLLDPVIALTTGQARPLPVEAYTSQAVFDWEAAHLFEGGWVCVGRAHDLAEPGDQRAFRIGREGILVVRDLAGRLRGYYNVCRHRGHELLEPGASRNLRAIRCPYHAWVYRLDGALGAAPRFGDVEGFDKADHPLIAACIREWEGWIFVNADGSAPPLDDHLDGLAELIGPWELSRLRDIERHEHEFDADWKTIAERFHDSGRRSSLSVGLFPNLLLGRHPTSVSSHRVEPLGPGRCTVECRWLVAPEAAERAGVASVCPGDSWGAVGREPRPPAGPVHAFMAQVARAYLGGRSSEPPIVHEPDPAGV